jgi:hypothetical protein
MSAGEQQRCIPISAATHAEGEASKETGASPATRSRSQDPAIAVVFADGGLEVPPGNRVVCLLVVRAAAAVPLPAQWAPPGSAGSTVPVTFCWAASAAVFGRAPESHPPQLAFIERAIGRPLPITARHGAANRVKAPG